MPPSTHHTAACALEPCLLPQPPAALRELHRALSSAWPERALRLPTIAAASAAASSSSLAANIATAASASSAGAPAANGHAHAASASPALDHSSPAPFADADAALLPAVIALLSEPVQIGCRTCTQRAKEIRTKQRESASKAAALDAAPGIHQRLRLSLESPALQLHFLQFAQRALFAPAPALTLSTSPSDSRANGAPSPRLPSPLPNRAARTAPPASFTALIRRFASEMDWRLDESAALAKSGLDPPPVFLPPAAAASSLSFATPSTFANYVDPRFEPGGLFVSTPCTLVAGRSFHHNAAILAELQALAKMDPELQTMMLPARQERYFKHGELAITSNTDATERLVEQLRSQTLAATLVKPSFASSATAAAAASSPSAARCSPLLPFQPARQSPWLRFEQTSEEAAIFSVEYELELDRLAKHKRREVESSEGETKASGGGEADGVPNAKQARTDDGKSEGVSTVAAADGEVMEDEDLIMLSQAPRVAAVARASAASAASCSSSTASSDSSPSSTPSVDPWQSISSPQLAPQFLEPEEQYPAWMLDAEEAATMAVLEPSLTQSQPDAVAPQKMSLDDAFEAASQDVHKAQNAGESNETADSRMQDHGAASSSRSSPSPAPAAAAAAFTHADLNTMRALLLAHCDRVGFDSALTEYLRHSVGAPEPAAILKSLSAQAGLSSLFAPFRDLVALAKRWREDVRSTAEFEQACAHLRMASLSLQAQLLFFAAFLDSNVSSTRVRILIGQSVLPLLRGWSDTRSARPPSLVLLLSLIARGHEDALVQAGLAPFLAHIFASPAAQSDENVPAHRMMRELYAPTCVGLSNAARLLLLQHLCMVSLALHERVQALVPLNPLHLSTAALMLFDALLKQLPLPAPFSDNYSALLALCAPSSSSSGAASSSSLLARLLPSAASAVQPDTVLSSLQLSLGDVSSLLLSVLLLASRSDKLRKQVKLTNLALPFVKAQAQGQQLKAGQPLHAVAQTLATGFGTISKKILDAVK